MKIGFDDLGATQITIDNHLLTVQQTRFPQLDIWFQSAKTSRGNQGDHSSAPVKDAMDSSELDKMEFDATTQTMLAQYGWGTLGFSGGWETQMDQGSIGDLTTLNCDFYREPHFGGVREGMRHYLKQCRGGSELIPNHA